MKAENVDKVMREASSLDEVALGRLCDVLEEIEAVDRSPPDGDASGVSVSVVPVVGSVLISRDPGDGL